MKAYARLWIALVVALCAPARAQPADPVEGFYVADIRETATAIELTADGRFQWVFSQGALDLVGEGRWTRDGDAVVLASDPPVVAPAFELAGTGRDAGAGLVVRLDEQSGDAWPFLDVEAEYENGERLRDQLRGTEYRFEPGRRIVGVRLGSVPFDFRSDRFAVDPDRDNVLTFRFVPNDLGRADFHAQRVLVEPNALSFDWRGTTLRYVRADGNGVPVEDQLCAAVAADRRRLDVGLAEPLADTIARSTYDLEAGRTEYGGPLRGGCGTIDLSIRFRGHRFDAGRVGGSDLIAWSLDPSARGQVEGVDFYYQDRLLELGEATARARGLHEWLVSAGFVTHPAPVDPESGDYRPFQVLDITDSPVRAADWGEAVRLLSAEDPGYMSMHLYTMRSGDYYARVMLDNVRRLSMDENGRAYHATEGGREWRLNVRMMLDPELLMEINFPSAGQ